MLERYPYAKKYWMFIPVHQSSSLMSHASTPSAVGMSLILVWRGFLRAWTFEESLQQLAPCDTGQAFQLGDLCPWYTGSLSELLTHSDTPWPSIQEHLPPTGFILLRLDRIQKGAILLTSALNMYVVYDYFMPCCVFVLLFEEPVGEVLIDYDCSGDGEREGEGSTFSQWPSSNSALCQQLIFLSPVAFLRTCSNPYVHVLI